MYGHTCHSLCPGLLQLTGGISKGLAVLTLDQDYIARFRDRPMSYQQRLLSGLQALMLGLYEGAVGEPHAHIHISTSRHFLWVLRQELPAACSSVKMLFPSDT